MTSSNETHEAIELVRRGWDHLRQQRPQAAWASWQRALRVAPDFPAALEAIETLASARELPAAARHVYRFQVPRGDDRRGHWDARLRGRDREQLDDAASAFAALSVADPDDAAAAYNEGLCLAWLGRNPEAIRALDRAVRLMAGDDFDRGVEAWTLAEVLRHGAGAEGMADDLRFVWIVDGADADVVARLSGRATLVAVPTPRDPITHEPPAVADVFEWLDRPMPDPAEVGGSGEELPRLMATLVRTARSLRLSSPDPESLDEIEAPLAHALGVGAGAGPVRREAIPLPLPLLDAALWTIRFPAGLDTATRDALTRRAVESYYEDRWIHVPRKGLDGRSPRDAARVASTDAVARAKLAAVVRLREQLGERPQTAALYQGYPFDRLRRRLGLELVDEAAVEPEDAACMGAAELDRLDPASLDDVRLADAFESAAGLRDDDRTARFAAALARREGPIFSRLDLAALFAPLVREAMAARDPGRAIGWLDRARAIGAGRSGRTFDIWRAEIHARGGDPDAAMETYESLLAATPSDAALAIDAAETMIDNGFAEHARPLLLHARDQARIAGDAGIEERARAIAEDAWT